MPSHANPVNWFEIPVNDLTKAFGRREFTRGLVFVKSAGRAKLRWFVLN